ncbi:efflux RND transporter periplasmic adaptor subunit [Planctomycetes bacterium K23_9]|uniref:Multidrug resistance protein MdtN n=1 Tax=Stieleria marina TaxID=1930275 RepID=A0A517P143_9BACT|nr:multidrug resistance protein MdtN [Planctomycetes bacterium K23_9]
MSQQTSQQSQSSFVPRTIAMLAVCVACVSAIGATRSENPTRSRQPMQYEGFTEPIRKIRVAGSESARISEVMAERGASVRQGETLMLLDSNVLNASRRIAKARAENSSRIEALRVEAEMKEVRLAKLQKLYDSGAGSPEETRRAKADARVAQLNVQSAIEDQRLAELELAEIEARIEQRRVCSPITGVITEVLKETGEYVSLNEPQVATVVQLDSLRVTFFVPTGLARRLADRSADQATADQTLQLVIPSDLPHEESQQLIGQIEYIGAVTEADSGRVRLDVLIENRDGRYRSGVRCVFAAQ